MNQEFDKPKNVHINRDDKGVARDLLHGDDPFVSKAPTPQLAAAEYLEKFGSLLGMAKAETANMGLTRSAEATDSGDELRFASEKSQFDSTTVMYQQTRFGLPVWHGGVAIQMKGKPYRVLGAQSTRHADLDAERPTPATLKKLEKLNKSALAKQLGLKEKNDFDAKTLHIDDRRLIVYRYAEAKRVLADAPHDTHDDLVHGHDHVALPLPAVPAAVEEGKHYIALEVHFSLTRRGEGPLNWIAILEAKTLAVLYLRAFVDNANGQVFLIDPMTTNGGPAPNAASAALNPIRTSVALPGLTASSPQALVGSIIRLSDAETPAAAAPTVPVASDFNFDARTNNFAAVNAYYHCDRFFRLLQDLGFTLSGFFGSGTTFPSVVDHRGLGTASVPSGNVINAHCLGTSGGLGILQTTFALADTTNTAQPLGIACDYRVVLHELGGHGVLYPHVHSPNFGFSHSAGDSVAAITCDPESQAPDRFVTFPWVNIGRRHDRTPAAGWGWSGNIALHPFDSALDYGGYNNEQILSTTMFRIYRSMGGDAAELPKRQFASRFAVYLILRAIASLTPATNPSNAAGFATALINADLGDWTSAGLSGGAYGKVVRWSFEKQGLYQPAGTATPNNSAGAPPAVDVYIDDGRHGEYTYQPNHWSCQAIWNRRHADGLLTHEEPVVGVTNYAYVKIKNRGTQAATNVVVKAYHANPAAGLVYPNDWQPMTTAQLAAGNVAPNNTAAIVVGPFQWTPTQVGHECMFMVVSATGDASNISNLTAGDSMPEWRLVPNDNNIGQRNVFPVAGGGGLKGLLATLDKQNIRIKNPHLAPAKMIVKVRMPKFLVERGWSAVLDNPGAGAFSLKSGEVKTVVLRFKTGKEFTANDVIKAKADAVIDIVATADGIVVGGMSYTLDPKVVGRVAAGAPKPGKKGAATKAAAKKTAAKRPAKKAATRK
ncbi:MAG: hypothetical protein ABJA61_01350 [Caldimonas sp.]